MEQYRRATLSSALSLLAIVYALGLPSGVGAQQPPEVSAAPAPRDRLLLLKNGGILKGDVTKAGDYYLLTKGDDSELRLPVADVEFACRDLEAAYFYKRDMMKAASAREHLLLAQWCLRHDLSARAADQILAAWAVEPKHPALASLEKRLEQLSAQSAAMAPSPQTAQANGKAQFASLTEIEETLATLNPQAIEQFTAEIQPLLLNRCGNANCHGQASTSGFHLDRPTGRGSMTLRLTQRNLFAALKQVDRRFPENSALLTSAVTAHGGSDEPAIGQLDARNSRQLASWVEKAALDEEPSQPLSIRRRQSSPLQTADESHQSGTSSQVVAASGETSFEDEANAAPAIFEQPITNDPSIDDQHETRDAFRPRDEFDPEIFNRMKSR